MDWIGHSLTEALVLFCWSVQQIFFEEPPKKSPAISCFCFMYTQKDFLQKELYEITIQQSRLDTIINLSILANMQNSALCGRHIIGFNCSIVPHHHSLRIKWQLKTIKYLFSFFCLFVYHNLCTFELRNGIAWIPDVAFVSVVDRSRLSTQALKQSKHK